MESIFNMTAKTTDREKDMIRKIVNSNYNDAGATGMTWSWDVCGDKSSAAVLGSLVRKGLAWAQGSGNDATCGLTNAGQDLYRSFSNH